MAVSGAGAKHTQHELREMAAFLHESRSQLTIAGIFKLSETLRAAECAVFFRNNHFNTLYKHTDNKLYILVTDQGYQAEQAVAWERLDNERGDTTFVTSEFEAYSAHEARHRKEQEELLSQIYIAEQVRRRHTWAAGAAAAPECSTWAAGASLSHGAAGAAAVPECNTMAAGAAHRAAGAAAAPECHAAVFPYNEGIRSETRNSRSPTTVTCTEESRSCDCASARHVARKRCR